MSRQRYRRFFSGYHKGQWWREKRFRLFQERGGDRGGRLILDAVNHVLPRSEEGRDVLPGEGCHGGGVVSVVTD